MRWLWDADDAAVRVLNAAVRRSPVAGRLVALAARWLAAAELALVVLLGLSGRPHAAARAVASVAAVYALVELVARSWRRRRPFEAVGGVHTLLRHRAPHRSFPSRHVASAVAMTVVAAPVSPTIARLMGRLAWGLALTRVGAGLHYPTDVVAGAALGVLVGWLLRRR